MKKRTKGKFKGDIKLKDLYKLYKLKLKSKKEKVENYSIFARVFKECNLLIKNKIVNESEEFKIPCRGGHLKILKKDRNYKNRNQIYVDFYQSKKLGKKVFHTSPYIYKWQWDKNKCIVKWKSAYYFKPCRKASRDLAKAIIIDKKDYFS